MSANSIPPATRTTTDRTKWFFVMPAMLWILVFSAFPLVYAIMTSFYSYTTAGKRNQFVGLDNFKRVFSDANLQQGMVTTLTFVASTVIVEMVFGSCWHCF
jgi:multiple sugar transport system permease protein